MLMLANVTSRDELARLLQNDLDSYKLDPSDDNWKKLAVQCLLVTSKIATEQEDITKIISDMDRMKAGFDMLTPGNV